MRGFLYLILCLIAPILLLSGLLGACSAPQTEAGLEAGLEAELETGLGATPDITLEAAAEAELEAVPEATPVDLTALPQGSNLYIRIFKREALLEVWAQSPNEAAYSLRRSFPICAWSGDLGPKLKEGDGQSPEGFYRVRKGSLNPNSSYHLSFNLGFPNRYDRAHGRTGSYLMVHGNCVSIGCYAMTDGGIEEIYRAVERALGGGQDHVKVHIFPFRMTEENMRAASGHKWESFWQNLKEGYDVFEAGGAPPKMGVDGKRYVVRS